MGDLYLGLKTSADVNAANGTIVMVERGGKLPPLAEGELQRLRDIGTPIFDSPQEETSPTPAFVAPFDGRDKAAVARAEAEAAKSAQVNLNANPELGDEGEPAKAAPPVSAGAKK